MYNLDKNVDVPGRAISVHLNQKGLEELCIDKPEQNARINHYAKRIYEFPIVLASLPFAAVFTGIGVLGVKFEDAKMAIKGEDDFSRLYANPFHVNKIVTADDSLHSQLKIRSMEPGANSKYRQMVKKGIVRPGDKKPVEGQNTSDAKYIPDPRVTKVGKILRKYSLDEAPQLLQLASQYFGKGLFFSQDNFYFFGNRPQTKESIRNAKPKDREKLGAGPWGLFSLDCVGRGKPGQNREASNNQKYSETYSKGRIWLTDWYILKNAPKVILGGKNS